MTDQELNERLAKVLGWKIEQRSAWRKWKAPNGNAVQLYDFSPATSVDALRKWVLPRVMSRGKWGAWCKKIMESAVVDPDALRAMMPVDAAWLKENISGPSDLRETLSAMYAAYATSFLPPTVLAAAALEVLEADDE